jgi:hypothetical protein
LRLALEDFLLMSFGGGGTLSSSEDSTTCDRVDRWDLTDPCLASVECADVNGRGGGLEAATRSKVMLHWG